MGFRLSKWDEKLLQYCDFFEDQMMNLEVNISLEKALDLGWTTLAHVFSREEVGIKESILAKFWPRVTPLMEGTHDPSQADKK